MDDDHHIPAVNVTDNAPAAAAEDPIVTDAGLVIEPLSACPDGGTFTDLLEWAIPTQAPSVPRNLPTQTPSSSPPPCSERPRRTPKPNSKYDQATYDLD